MLTIAIKQTMQCGICEKSVVGRSPLVFVGGSGKPFGSCGDHRCIAFMEVLGETKVLEETCHVCKGKECDPRYVMKVKYEKFSGMMNVFFCSKECHTTYEQKVGNAKVCDKCHKDVGATDVRCTQCGVPRYCSEKCLADDWKLSHHEDCEDFQKKVKMTKSETREGFMKYMTERMTNFMKQLDASGDACECEIDTSKN